MSIRYNATTLKHFMKLYVGIQNKRLVASSNSDRQAASPIFIQGDNKPLEIHLLASEYVAIPMPFHSQMDLASVILSEITLYL